MRTFVLVFGFILTVVIFCKAEEDRDKPGNILGVLFAKGPKRHKHQRRELDFEPFYFDEDVDYEPCDFDEDIPGRCMPLEECDFPDREELMTADDEKMCLLEEVCCPLKEDQLIEKPMRRKDDQSEPRRKYHQSELSKRKDDKSEEMPAGSRPMGSPFPKPPVCGELVVVEDRITAGKNAQPGKFPWMAALWYSSKESFLAGGSVITERHVMTAAHCIRSDLHHVRVGDVDLIREDDDAAPVDVMIRRAIRHEKYDKLTRVNDIGLLVLQKEIKFSRFVKPICLPPIDTPLRHFRKTSFVGEDAVVAGWGAIQYKGPALSWLQFAIIKVLDRAKCEVAYEKHQVVIDDGVLCAGDPGRQGERKDACSGDSGGPLVYSEPSKLQYYQIGIVAYGFECGRPDYPGLYTRVEHHLPWLEKTVLEN